MRYTKEVTNLDFLIQALKNGAVYDLEQPRYQNAPSFPAHEPGFILALHRRHERGLGESRTSASALITMAEHSGTHIDAICHQALDMKLYGNLEVDASIQTSRGFTQLGVETYEPILARGVLLDLAKQAKVDCFSEKELIDPELVRETVQANNIELRPNDVVLLRTGNAQHWSDRIRYQNGPGIHPETSRWLASFPIQGVGADNLAWDLPGHMDENHNTLPGHVSLIVEQGIWIIESLNLERLALDNVQSFLFVCLPLKMKGATGSPVRPIALVI
jgi:kynurenine formamidase